MRAFFAITGLISFVAVGVFVYFMLWPYAVVFAVGVGVCVCGWAYECADVTEPQSPPIDGEKLRQFFEAQGKAATLSEVAACNARVLEAESRALIAENEVARLKKKLAPFEQSRKRAVKGADGKFVKRAA